MTLRWMRIGFFSFFFLTLAFAVNLMMFQPPNGRVASKQRPVPPLQREAPKPANVATGSIALLNTGYRAKVEKAAQARTADSPEVVRAVQRELEGRGYEVGPADGMPGLVTRASVMAFEADHGMTLTGVPSEQLLQAILLGAPQATRNPRAEPGPEAEQVIRTVQQSLATLGYAPGTVDGRLGDQTVRTIREFEMDQQLPQTGRISGQLVARLARLAGQGHIADGR
jgi:peptidoglycan hydrolase-like protein with peptidoglycan-binding domain